MRKILFLLTFTLLTLCADEELPPVTLATVKLPQIRLAEIPTVSAAAKLATATVNLPVIPSTAPQLNAAKARMLLKKTLFRDKRNIDNEPAANENLASWVEIFQAHKEYTFPHVPVSQGLRMVAEVRWPVSEEVLASNLTWYKDKGYNAVLLTFDGSEEPYQLTQLADKITSAGMKVYFAFGGAENLKLSVFIHPYKLGRLITALAPKCAGMLLHWRRTSQHLLLPDRAFIDFLVRHGREANPALQIIGESYYGENAESKGAFVLSTSLPAGSSAILLTNVGYSFYSPPKALKLLNGQLTPVLVLILGAKPYYATVNPNNLSFEQNWQIKRMLEENFVAAGATGTVTLHGDGSNGLFNSFHTDNLGQTAR